MIREHIEETYEEENEERIQLEESMEIWAASLKRELQEWFSTADMVEAAAHQIIEHTPDLELKMKLDHVSVNGILSDFGDTIHMAKVKGRYVTIIEADTIEFGKGVSPIEFHRPDDLHEIIERISRKGVGEY